MRRLPVLMLLLAAGALLPVRAETPDTGRDFVIATLRATTEHLRRGTPVRLSAETFPYDAWARCLWSEEWRRDTAVLAGYEALRRAARMRHANYEPFMYLADALVRQASRGDTLAMRDLLRLYRGADGEMGETVEESVTEVFGRRPEIVVRAWCAEPPGVELAVGDERAVGRVRRAVRRLVERGAIGLGCGESFLRAVTTW